MRGEHLGLVIIWILLILFWAVGIPKLESGAENHFNKTFDAVKSNTNLVFSKTNMTGAERTNYIINSCQIAFGNDNYREGDVDLCKEKMGLN